MLDYDTKCVTKSKLLISGVRTKLSIFMCGTSCIVRCYHVKHAYY